MPKTVRKRTQARLVIVHEMNQETQYDVLGEELGCWGVGEFESWRVTGLGCRGVCGTRRGMSSPDLHRPHPPFTALTRPRLPTY